MLLTYYVSFSCSSARAEQMRQMQMNQTQQPQGGQMQLTPNQILLLEEKRRRFSLQHAQQQQQLNSMVGSNMSRSSSTASNLSQSQLSQSQNEIIAQNLRQQQHQTQMTRMTWTMRRKSPPNLVTTSCLQDALAVQLQESSSNCFSSKRGTLFHSTKRRIMVILLSHLDLVSTSLLQTKLMLSLGELIGS